MTKSQLINFFNMTGNEDQGDQYSQILPYLDFDGTQYIDLGLTPNDTMGFYVKSMIFRTEYSGAGNPLVASRCDDNFFMPGVIVHYNNIYIYYGAHITSNVMPKQDYRNKLMEFKTNLYGDKKGVYIMDDRIIAVHELPTLSLGNYRHLYIGLMPLPNGSERYFKGRGYAVQITQGDKLIRDFMPVVDIQGVKCWHDKIERKNYYSKGGAF